MTHHLFDEIHAGDTVSIENSDKSELQISVICHSGCQFDFELLPGQSLGFSADGMGAKVVLRKGNPAGLLMIKPETAS